MSPQRYWVVMLLLIVFPLSQLVPNEDIATTAYDESESTPYEITPESVVNPPQLSAPGSGIFERLFSASARMFLTGTVGGIRKRVFSASNLPEKLSLSSPSLRC